MSDERWKPVAPIYRWLIAAASLIAPRRLRAAWKKEWLAEVEHRWLRYQAWRKLNWRKRLDLLKLSSGAFADAGWLQLKQLREGFFQDLRFGGRLLINQPGFTTVATTTMALGIGALVAVFSIANSVLLRPLPYRDADELMFVGQASRQADAAQMLVSFPDFDDWRRQNQVFAEMAAYDTGSVALSGASESEWPEWVAGAEVSASLFPLLGVEPMLGRGFLPEDDRPGADRVVVIGHDLWQRRFAANPELVGKTLMIHGRQYRVIGVAPPQFKFPEHAEVWTLLARDPLRESQEIRNCQIVARLKRGVTAERAQAEMTALIARAESRQVGHGEARALVAPLRDFFVRDARQAILIFLCTASFVLLIACANVANLTLARATARQREIAIRLALGASRARIVRQLLTESLLLAALGGVAGLLLGWWGKETLLAAMPELPFWASFGLDWRVYGFVLLLSLGAGLIFGLAPALSAMKTSLSFSLKESGSGRRASRLRQLFAVSEIALALVLLIGAGVMVKGFLRLRQIDPGFTPDRILTMRMTLPEARYRQPQQRLAFYDQVLQRVKSLPGTQAAAISQLPLGGDRWDEIYSVENRPAAPREAPTVAAHRVVTPGYFELMGIRLRRGRDFNERDRAGQPLAVIVNESLARRHWPGEDPLGKRLKYGAADLRSPWLTVVGVVGDVKLEDVRRESRDTIYAPLGQAPVEAMALVIRSGGDPLGLVPTVREQIRALDRDLPVYQIRTMDEALAQRVWDSRFFSWLLATLAGLAVTLAVVGVYGVVSQAVAQRSREIGIRMALGASPNAVRALVMGQVLRLALAGVAAGLAASLALVRALAALMSEVNATDPAIFAGGAMLLAAAALAASYIPARKAMKLDPLVTLRAE